MFTRIISPSLSPNTDRTDVVKTIEVLFTPQTWKEGSALPWVREWFAHYLGEGELAFFESGRSALLAILKAFGIGAGDEVMLQAFTCVAVPNSVLWAGAKPIYVDIDATYNMDPSDAKGKITKKTKALIVQHTFGIPAQVDKLLALAKKYKLILIEDCAHSLGATYQGRKIGTLGDAAFFSFGRDKVVSSVWGGLGYIKYPWPVRQGGQISPRKDSGQANIKYQKKLRDIEQSLPYPSAFWIFQQLLHPIVFSAILPSYDLGAGKLLLLVLQKLGLLSLPVYKEELRGGRPAGFPAKFTNALAALLINQLKKLERYNRERQENARYYWETLKSKKNITATPFIEGATFLRYPIFVNHPAEFFQKAKKQGILLGNWYHNIIDPVGVDFAAVGYQLGSCPKAEKAAKHVLNLPTRIMNKTAEQVCQVM